MVNLGAEITWRFSFGGFKMSLKEGVSLSFITQICVGIKYLALFSIDFIGLSNQVKSSSHWGMPLWIFCICRFCFYSQWEVFVLFCFLPSSTLRFILVSWQRFSSFLTKDNEIIVLLWFLKKSLYCSSFYLWNLKQNKSQN